MKLCPLCVACRFFAGKVSSLLGLLPSCLLPACKALCFSSAFPVSSLRCFSFGSPSCVLASSTSLLRFCSVLASSAFALVISALSSSLRCFASGFVSCVRVPSSSLFRFLSAMAAQTSAMARAFVSSAALRATFACVCVAATRCTALLMLPRGMGHCQQLLQTWSPLQERCCASQDSKAHAACFTLQTLHLHQPHALPEQSKHTLPPLRARFQAPPENFFSSLRVLQTLHTCVCSHVLHIR